MAETSLPRITTRPQPAPDRLVVKGTLLVTSTLTVMASATVSAALPALRTEFATVPNVELLVRLVLTLPALFIVMGAPLAGIMVDKLGRKPMLVVSAILYGVAGASGYVLNTLGAILVGRAILGIAVAGLMTSVTTLIADYYDGQQRSKLLGLQAAFMGIGGSVFLTLGGFLAEMSWREPFLIYLFSLVMLPFILFVLYEPERKSTSPDQHRHMSNCDDCIAEQQRMERAAPPTLQTSPPVGLMVFVYSVITFIQIVYFTVPIQLPFYLETTVGAGASAAGLAVAGMALFFAIAAGMFGWLNSHLDHIVTVALGFLLVAVGYGLLFIGSSWWFIALALAVAGFGIGMIMPNMNVWLTEKIPATLRGRALGGFTTAVFLGQFLSSLIVQPLGATVGIGGSFGVIAAVIGVLAVVVFASQHALAALGEPSSQ